LIAADSPLVNAGGSPAGCPSQDQRGFARPVSTTCDVGAYEHGSGLEAIVLATPGEAELDFDQDGYGVSADCNDKDSQINPGAAETPDDKIDSNCNRDDDK
jgi:hypothetical protein